MDTKRIFVKCGNSISVFIAIYYSQEDLTLVDLESKPIQSHCDPSKWEVEEIKTVHEYLLRSTYLPSPTNREIPLWDTFPEDLQIDPEYIKYQTAA